MLNWYTSIKSRIDACPTSTRTTCTTFESENIVSTLSTCTTCTTLHPNVGHVGRVDSPQAEKQLLENSFCPLQFLLEHDVGIANISPPNGITLATGYSCTQELRHRIEFWTLGYFDRLLATLGETRVITKKVHCISLNRYKLLRA